ncbi:hypothetical protein PR003_g7776 [Phytophthora rubi]|uniref:Uncharacterized protein n=1 Tax=Phytophthora rubi TaxID=129364 RepID=A0A6A4FKX4_9STRA|nr:hypothetical protein PR003_g7776 [Phytophthora rubi]
MSLAYSVTEQYNLIIDPLQDSNGTCRAQDELRTDAIDFSNLRWDRLEKKWNELQVGHQGSYSVERLESLDHYWKTASTLRVLLVCLLTPIPALAAALLLESLLLRSPSEGWTANWVFWVRLLLMELILGFAGNSQVNAFVPGLNFTIRKRLVIALGTSVGYVATCILAASTIGFPVPLMMQFGVIPISIYTPLMTRIVLGPVLVAKDSPFKYDSDVFHCFFFAHMTLIGIFPLYKVLYNHVPVNYRSVVVLVLPLWKFAAKHFVVSSTRKLVDFMPELVAFSVDFFGTLFVSVCMYTSGSFYLSALFILADVGQSFLEFREIHANAKVVLELLHDRRASQQRHPRKINRRPSSIVTTELLAMVIAVTRNPNAFEVKSMQAARLWSCLPHPLTHSSNAGRFRAVRSNRRAYYPPNDSKNSQFQPILFRSVFVLPTPVESALNTAPASDVIEATYIQSLTADEYNSNFRAAERAKQIALQGLQLLFHCEYLALVEYVECVVPLVFVTYELVLRKLPNVIYYPDDAGNWEAASVANLVVFALLEVGSFIMLNFFLQSKFSFSPVHQLAFVLENQMCAVQVHLFVSLTILLQYELSHLGADFSLEFKWLRDK